MTVIGHRGGIPGWSSTFYVDALAFSPDGSRLATGGQDGAVRIWDVKTGEELQVIYLTPPALPE